MFSEVRQKTAAAQVFCNNVTLRNTRVETVGYANGGECSNRPLGL